MAELVLTGGTVAVVTRDATPGGAASPETNLAGDAGMPAGQASAPPAVALDSAASPPPVAEPRLAIALDEETLFGLMWGTI